MRIFSTQIFNINVQSQHITPNRKAAFTTKPIGVDSCSFTGYSSKLKAIPKLPCSCCGNIMLTNDDLNNIQKEALFLPSKNMLATIYSNTPNSLANNKETMKLLSKIANKYPKDSFHAISNKKDLNGLLTKAEVNLFKAQLETIAEIGPSAKRVTKALEKHAEHLHPIEKEAFLKIRKLSHKNPKLTMKNILNKPEIYNLHLQNLIKKQESILKEVQSYTKDLSPYSKKIIAEKLEAATEILIAENSQYRKKRTRVIELFNDLDEVIPEKNITEKIKSAILKLPNSANDIDAFFVKYAQRSSSEIANRILRQNLATIEHIKPRRREGDRGESDESNYIVMCSKCNGERQQKPYPEWLQIHPEMITNVQKQIDIIINKINIGNYELSSNYPNKVKQSLITESAGLINIDTSRLVEKSNDDFTKELIKKYNGRLVEN